jgi:hypothetical protein
LQVEIISRLMLARAAVRRMRIGSIQRQNLKARPCQLMLFEKGREIPGIHARKIFSRVKENATGIRYRHWDNMQVPFCDQSTYNPLLGVRDTIIFPSCCLVIIWSYNCVQDMAALIEKRFELIPTAPGSDWRDLPNAVRTPQLTSLTHAPGGVEPKLFFPYPALALISDSAFFKKR